MFTQIVSRLSVVFEGTIRWIADTYKTIQSYIQKISKENKTRISGLMMVSKMLSVMFLLALVPMDGANSQKEQPIEIKFDQSSPLAVSGKNRQVAIETGTAKIDAKNSRRVASAANSAQSVKRDPSYFRGLYERAGAAYGIPWQLIEAVHYVETGASDSTSRSSYAGATGPMQFMPGTWRAYGVDANGDGSADIHNVDDAVFGAANLLAAGGAAEGDYQSALFNYNHAQWYVDKVMGVARDAGM